MQAKPAYFERHQQQDCQEFLRHLLDNLHEEAKRKLTITTTEFVLNDEIFSYQSFPFRSNDDFVKDHLMGTCIHSSKCLTCESMSNSEDLFYDLSIGFHEQSSVGGEQTKIFDFQSLLDQTFAWESLINENQFACDKCQKKQDGARRMHLTSYPNYLVILLKRFVHNRLTGKYEKCLDRTTLPEYIQLPTNNDDLHSYRLKAIVVHHGLSMNSGHYYAFVMINNDDLTEKTNANQLGWWLFNDTHVEHLTFENVCAHFQRFQSATPYVLIFEKQIQGKNLFRSNIREFRCFSEKDAEVKPSTILPYLQTMVDRDNQLYTQVNIKDDSSPVKTVSLPRNKNVLDVHLDLPICPTSQNPIYETRDVKIKVPIAVHLVYSNAMYDKHLCAKNRCEQLEVTHPSPLFFYCQCTD